MKNDNWLIAFYLCFLEFVFLVSAVAIGYEAAGRHYQDEAIERGYGEYVVKDRAAVFQWKGGK